jgi:hypothetical protein
MNGAHLMMNWSWNCRNGDGISMGLFSLVCWSLIFFWFCLLIIACFFAEGFRDRAWEGGEVSMMKAIVAWLLTNERVPEH